MSQRLDIDALRTLCAIEDFGGITRASEQLALSQSAVSHKVKRLEQGIECDLLTRRSGASLLTDDGKRLVGYARRILALHDEALLNMSKRTLAGKIRLGMTEDTTSSDLSRVLGRFTRLHPNVQVKTHVRQSVVLEGEMERGEIDLGVMQVFSHRKHAADLVLSEDALVWVKAVDLELDFDKALPFLAYDENCFYRQWAEQVGNMPEAGLNTVLECASTAGIVSAIHSGLGVALLPGRYVTPEMQVLDDTFPEPPNISYVVRVPQRVKSVAVKTLANEIHAEGAQAPVLRIA
ncbi:HTH-type transcriptional regulator GltR [Roseovarius albus]|uniref:HTH-type transcriptional regulator GltR n=1 Tax=Roseovarius albus TaxID=1247867 RepID=A0A1X6Y959_9RHOB|nr:LysR family transcriptional regulator [Roseovarius albus]SLN14414.1 HTH-type transcriptional regulator GltR [Roseovarius albus]